MLIESAPAQKNSAELVFAETKLIIQIQPLTVEIVHVVFSLLASKAAVDFVLA